MDKNKEQEIKDFLNFIIAEAKSKGKDPNAYAKELGEDGMKEAYKRFKALKLKAAHGAKLQYFRTLKNQCAEDEELYYYKKGGSVGCGCKKKEDGGEMKPKKDCGGGPVAKFKMRKAEPGMKMIQLAEANKERKKKEEQEKKKKGTWAETSKVVGKDYQRGNGGPKAKVQDSAVPKEDVPSHDKLKFRGLKAKSDHMKCGGAVAKFKKHYLGGILNGIPFIKKV